MPETQAVARKLRHIPGLRAGQAVSVHVRGGGGGRRLAPRAPVRVPDAAPGLGLHRRLRRARGVARTSAPVRVRTGHQECLALPRVELQSRAAAMKRTYLG